MKTNAVIATLLLAVVFCSPPVWASDADELVAMTKAFLASSHQESAHASFWAEDLVYTSSAGMRFGKAQILQGFENEDVSTDEPTMVYSGENFDVRVYGDTAVVAFKLVGTPSAADAEVLYYFNTGTFLRRDGRWQVVAWQATKVPPAE